MPLGEGHFLSERREIKEKVQTVKFRVANMVKKKKKGIFSVVPVERHKTNYPACFVSMKTARMYRVQDVCNTFHLSKDKACLETSIMTKHRLEVKHSERSQMLKEVNLGNCFTAFGN